MKTIELVGIIVRGARTHVVQLALAWKVERLFAWLHNFRRLVVRYEYHSDNFFGFCT
jgi:transposase